LALQLGKVTKNKYSIQYGKRLEEWFPTLKINQKYYGLLMALFITIALDSAMSFTMVSVTTGWTAGFLEKFVNAWLIGFAVILPTSLLVFPLARKLVNRLTSEQNSPAKIKR
jgi:membrane protein implicated in regulation of membrane protease activity